MANHERRQLRIAPVMTGGTSLAVWMGGVTAELYRVLDADPGPEPEHDADGNPAPPAPAPPEGEIDIYRELLRLTQTRPVIDVITGTSAGGLNGVLLAAAMNCGLSAKDFLATRETWMQVGDIEKLIRKPNEVNPPSLLLGDKFFTAELEKVLARWQDQADLKESKPEPARVDLVTTLTTVTGVPSARHDDFGETIPQTDFAQTLRFRLQDFEGDDWPQRLAIAARTSASLPAIFEPSFIPVGPDDAKSTKKPDFEDNASFAVSRWAVDGGVVVNLPLTEAIDRIFDRRAYGEVRRVVVYVSPTPSPVRAAETDDHDEPPTVLKSTLTVATAPRAEGVAADIDAIRRTNSQVDRQMSTRRYLKSVVDAIIAEADQAAGNTNADTPMFDAYLTGRSRQSLERMLSRLRTAKSVKLPIEDGPLIETLSKVRRRLLPRTLDRPPDLADPRGPDKGCDLEARAAIWPWGIAPVEEAISIAIGVVTRVEKLMLDPLYDNASVDAAHIAAARAHITDAQKMTTSIREHDERFWRAQFLTFPPEDADGGPPDQATIEAWMCAAYNGWSAETELDPVSTLGEPTKGIEREPLEWLRAAHRLATLALLAVQPDFAGSGPASPDPDPVRLPSSPDPVALHDELTTLLVDPETDDDPRARLDDKRGAGHRAPDDAGEKQIGDVQRRLLATHVAQTLMLGSVASREQSVELLQLSWNAANQLDPDRAPDDKLAGPELGRLGAFVKTSWRANDWFWGRMDGTQRLITLLLDPNRLRALYLGGVVQLDEKGEPTATMAVELQDWIARLAGVDPEDLPEAVTDELEKLRNPTCPLDTLPESANLIARNAQIEIADDELPHIAEQIEDSAYRGGNERSSRAFTRKLKRATVSGEVATVATADTVDNKHQPALDSTQVPELVESLQLGAETIRSEIGFGLLNRIASRLASVTVNVVTADGSGVPGARFLRPLRVPLQAVNSVVSVMTRATPLSQTIMAIVMAIAGAIVALRLVGLDTPPGTFVVSAILLTGLVVGSMFRSGHLLLGSFVFAVSAIISLAVTGSDLETVLYDTPRSSVEQEIEEGTTFRVLDGTTFRITVDGEGSTRVFRDEQVDGENATITVRDADIAIEGDEVETTEWKQWGFIAEWAVFRWAMALLTGLVIHGVIRRFRARQVAYQRRSDARARRKRTGIGLDSAAAPRPPSRLARNAKIATTLVAGGITILGAPWFFEGLLTGTAPVAGEALSGVALCKARLVGFAETLNGFELELVLAVMVLVSVLLSFGVDLAVSRRARQAADWLRGLLPARSRGVSS